MNTPDTARTYVAAVAWREAGEETGITGLRVLRDALDIDIHRVAPPAEDPHLHLDVQAAEALRADLEEAYPACDIELQYGGQPIYYYTVSVE